jgi:ABC-type Fe3+-hydroxamate transport system substrate-binding protein
VGVTKFCVEPAEAVAAIPKVGGTKNPDIRAVLELKPDFVVANAEENRREDVARLKDRGIPVFTTYPRTVASAAESILKLGRAVQREKRADALVRRIVRVVSEIEAGLGPWSKLRLRVFCPIWKKPWMTFNADTYAHDVLRMMGFYNVFAAAGERYPRTTLEAALEHRPDLVLLPDEPYAFGPAEVAEIKALLPRALGRRVLLVSGRDLHWYGAHMVRGLKTLSARLARVRAALV